MAGDFDLSEPLRGEQRIVWCREPGCRHGVDLSAYPNALCADGTYDCAAHLYGRGGRLTYADILRETADDLIDFASGGYGIDSNYEPWMRVRAAHLRALADLLDKEKRFIECTVGFELRERLDVSPSYQKTGKWINRLFSPLPDSPG